jgi:hypothetical protein
MREAQALPTFCSSVSLMEKSSLALKKNSKVYRFLGKNENILQLEQSETKTKPNKQIPTMLLMKIQ